MEILTVYDIRDAKRLKKVADLMQRYGIRVQKSVFECDLSESAYREMKRYALRLIDPSKDSVRFYPLLNGGRQKQEIIGQGEMVDFPDFYLS